MREPQVSSAKRFSILIHDDPAFSYTWSVDGGMILSQTDDWIEVQWNVQGPKNVSVYVSNGGCNTTSSPLIITVLPVPAPVITGPPGPPVNTQNIYQVSAPVPGQ